MKRLLSVLFVFATASTASAVPIVATFNGDTNGPKPNGFASVATPLVTFSDTVGAGLLVDIPFAEGNGTRALTVLDDFDGSKLRMDFGALMGTLSLDFGNDDPFFSAAGDLAWLQVFNGATLVGTASVVLNRNDAMDQTIVFSGPAFNTAFFWFGNPSGTGFTSGPFGGLAEVVDNVTFDIATTSVPEPATLALLGVGLAGGALRRRLGLIRFGGGGR